MREQIGETERNLFIAMVSEHTVKKDTVSMDDQIYYDLKIYGDPLFDLLHELAEKFETDFSGLRLIEYAPGEGAELIRPIMLAFGRRPYKSLAVGDLWKAVINGRW
ncbi:MULTISPECIES: DUF1493 family protein [unclassified Erythrobacter]|jgi:hypothetical protein|uniref:DUF1493 family protein n=1 Tax=unclassified Erythrobacter TaxID=2633097 RepID=UPI0007B9A038|nr:MULTISPECIES: DUF1493 family protein [unclassified Erythrobacter]KZY90515.1 hypothetical protein A3745_06745 [Erythrobacter sp. HI0074]KZZ07933.1 hypothetical protein A3748_13100 [Erythrobacter sp. HI0077]|tara:strand:- start:293 stop:610 length:318 start_codon:yes stop_codon:yes gene_type:complete